MENKYNAGDKVWYNNKQGVILHASELNTPRELREYEYLIAWEGQKFTVDSRHCFPVKRAEEYELGSILSYDKDDVVYGKLLVKTHKEGWNVVSPKNGNMDIWRNGEVNMGLFGQRGSTHVVLDNGYWED